MATSTKDLLKARLVEAQKELVDLDGQAAPLRAERDKLAETIAPAEARLYDLNQAIKALEMPVRSDLVVEIAQLEKLLTPKGPPRLIGPPEPAVAAGETQAAGV